MKPLHLLLAGAVLSAALMDTAGAQARSVGGGFRHLPPPPIANGPFLGWPGVYVVDRVQVIEREVVKEVPVAAPLPEPPPPPRKPYKLGAMYDSLPSPCLKMIEDGASYYHCSGEWYRQSGSGSAVQYVAIREP